MRNSTITVLLYDFYSDFFAAVCLSVVYSVLFCLFTTKNSQMRAKPFHKGVVVQLVVILLFLLSFLSVGKKGMKSAMHVML